LARERFLRTLRHLAECYQAFERYSGAHVRTLGLTPSQFDIIVTLGNTRGMTFRVLGEETLITKGTLTGVVDRLEEKGLVERRAVKDDRRSTIVRLTARGESEFKRVFPAHVAHLKRAFGRLTGPELEALEALLAKLRGRLARQARGV
jgi:DNA-binding MarR family transcriptional regulator